MLVIAMQLQASQKFLIQKMLQKTLKLFVILPASLDLRNGGKYEICFKIFSSKIMDKNTAVYPPYYGKVIKQPHNRDTV